MRRPALGGACHPRPNGARAQWTYMSDPQADIKSNAARIHEINDTVRFTMWSVFKLERPIGGDDVVRKSEAAEVETLLAELAGTTWSSAGCTTSPACAPTPT